MNSSEKPLVLEATPQACWNALSNDTAARLIDVRTRPEWGFVGGPDVSEAGHSVIQIEWAVYPDMSINSAFVTALMEKLEGHMPTQLFFICRSGVRSLSAAQAVIGSEALTDVPCVNVTGGFEGDEDSRGQRGRVNGWKADGLAWRQS